MTFPIRIDRLRNRYHLSSPDEDAEGVRRRLDEVVTSRVTAELDRVLPEVLAELGLGPDAAVAVARIAVRLRIRGGEIPDARIASAWTAAIAEAVRRAIEPLAKAGGGFTSEAAVFPDRFEAEIEALREASQGLPAPWWAGKLLGDGGEAPRPATLVARWLSECPERVAPAIARIATESPLGMERLFTEAEARSLEERLWAARGERLNELRDGRASGQASRGGSGARFEGDGRRLDGASEATDKDGGLGVFYTAPPISADVLRVAGRTRALLAGKFLMACLVLAERPQMGRRAIERLTLALRAPPGGRPERRTGSVEGDVSPSESAPPGRGEGGRATDDIESRQGGSDRGPAPRKGMDEGVEEGSGEGPRRDAPREDARVDRLRSSGKPAETGGVDTPLARPSDGGESASLRVVLGEHATAVSGLLFLARRVARSPWLDAFEGGALESRLLAFAQTVLLRALGGLSTAQRKAMIARERAIVAAFSGSARVPERLDEIPDGAAAVDAGALADEIAREIPAEIGAFEPGIRAVYGPGIEPFEEGSPRRGLARLVLRPGRLVISEHRADLFLPMRAIDVALRIGGWDIDPGFLPHTGRVIRFHYEER